MKRLGLVLIAIIMVFSLVSCGIPEEEIRKELYGPWGTSYTSGAGYTFYTFYIFSSDDTVQYVYTGMNDMIYTEHTGTYKIEKDEIICKLKGENGSMTTVLNYSFEDGELSIIDNSAEGDGIFMKVK